MARIARYTANTPVALMLEALEQDGALIVEGLLEAESRSRLNREIEPRLSGADPAMEHLNASVAAFCGTQVRHLSGLAGKSGTFAEQVMCHPIYLALCDHVLLPNCAEYQLNLAHLMERGPGAMAQALHRDEDVWIHFPRPRPELMLASVVALVDFTRDNGATVVVPGSH